MTPYDTMRDILGLFLAAGAELLSRIRIYRRWCGGRWEKWWIAPPVASSMWFQIGPNGERPYGCVMLDAVEDYTTRPAGLSAGPYRTLPASSISPSMTQPAESPQKKD